MQTPLQRKMPTNIWQYANYACFYIFLLPSSLAFYAIISEMTDGKKLGASGDVYCIKVN